MRATKVNRLLGGVALALTIAAGIGLARAADDAAAPEPSWDDVPVVPLWRAVATGKVEASGSQPRSYKELVVHVRSRSGERVVVDLAGSHLRPQSLDSCQRLGLGPPAVTASVESRGPGTACVALEPGEERTIRMNTCCLDARKRAPSKQKFVASRHALPRVRSQVLRWWVDNPEVPQSAVNSAIWRNRSEVVVSPGARTPRRSRPVRKAFLHGGISYQLKNGELTSLDAEGVRRVLGSQIQTVYPCDDALYAVMPGDDRKPDLWRLAPTGESPWGFVLDLDGTHPLLDLFPVDGGDFILLYPDRVARYDHEGGRAHELFGIKSPAYLSARVATRKGAIDVTVHDPRVRGIQRAGEIEGQSAGRFEIWRVDTGTGTAAMRDRFWNVSSIAAGPAGIYGLSHRGELRRERGGKFKDLGPVDVYASIVAVGRRRVWTIDRERRLVAVDASSGRRVFAVASPFARGDRIDLDPVTDDLGYCTGEGFFVVRAADGTVEKLPETESDDDDDS